MGTNVTDDDLVLTHTVTSLIVQNTVYLDEDPCIIVLHVSIHVQ